jgi:chromate reductase, NAD(P)H dehydrogenase (quinone)
MRILAFAASLRKGSLNRKLIEVAAAIARRAGAEVELAGFRAFDMPLYDADENEAIGLPPGARALKQGLEAADALMIASPESNYSISGVLKNAIDWVSRSRPMPWRGKTVYLLSASPSPMGGIRGLWQTRIPLEGCGALVFPDMFALSNAGAAFAEDGQLRDAALLERLEREVLGFVRLAESLAPVCSGAGNGAAKERQQQIVTALEDESKIQPQSGC